MRPSFYTALIIPRRRNTELPLPSGGFGVDRFWPARRGSGIPNAGWRAPDVRALSAALGGGRVFKAEPLYGPGFTHEALKKMWAYRTPALARRVVAGRQLPADGRPGIVTMPGGHRYKNYTHYFLSLIQYTDIYRCRLQ